MLAFYLMLPHAAFGFTGPGCTCFEKGLKCGKEGFVCHCCQEKHALSHNGTVIARCQAASSDFNIAHPPAALGTVSLIMAMPGPDTVAIFIDRSFHENTKTPPLRPPAPLPPA